MKILIITNHSYMLYQFRREFIKKLLKDYEVVISTPYMGHEDDLKEMGCKVIDTYVDRRGMNPIKDYKLLKKYVGIIQEEKPDKVITYSIKPNIYAGMVCQHKHVPYYTNVQGLGTAFQNSFLASFVSFLYKFAFKEVKTVFFENKENADLFLQKKIIPIKKIKILNGAGVNLDHYQYYPYPVRKKIHFLFVGRIMKEKGVDELFDAFEKLHEHHDVILDIVGFFEDEYRNKVNKLVDEGFVCFHGFQKDVRPFYQKSHCIVLPSYHEGMSNVLLEASAIGRPIITSNISGCKEAVDDNENGYLVSVKDSHDLFLKMKKFVELENNQKEIMGIYGRIKMEKEFNKEDIVKATFESVMI